MLYDKMLQIEWGAPREILPQFAVCAPPPGLMAVRQDEVEFFCVLSRCGVLCQKFFGYLNAFFFVYSKILLL